MVTDAIESGAVSGVALSEVEAMQPITVTSVVPQMTTSERLALPSESQVWTLSPLNGDSCISH